MRSTAGEFAKEFPKIASRLSLDEFACGDPYVERLLEGFAFLAARVQLKLDAEFPQFTQSILETVYPHYLSPTPSMAVVEFAFDTEPSGLENGFQLKRDTVLRSVMESDNRVACEYRTGHSVTLWPVRITRAGDRPAGHRGDHESVRWLRHGDVQPHTGGSCEAG